MFFIDINCDLGEGMRTDAAIMPFISSANIACGGHAGDEKSMEETIKLCLKNRVAIGAHPSFPDKENFGRSEMTLGTDEIRDIVLQQLKNFGKIVSRLGASLHHVKPHGALYNMSAKNISLARAIAEAVKIFDSNLVIYGLSGSHSIYEAKAVGLKTASEVFADRTYQDDGSLTPRSQPEAEVEDVNSAVHQALHLIKEGIVKTISGKQILLVAETICLHGDGKQALSFAKAIHEAMEKEDIVIAKI